VAARVEQIGPTNVAELIPAVERATFELVVEVLREPGPPSKPEKFDPTRHQQRDDIEWAPRVWLNESGRVGRFAGDVFDGFVEVPLIAVDVVGSGAYLIAPETLGMNKLQSMSGSRQFGLLEAGKGKQAEEEYLHSLFLLAHPEVALFEVGKALICEGDGKPAGHMIGGMLFMRTASGEVVAVRSPKGVLRTSEGAADAAQYARLIEQYKLLDETPKLTKMPATAADFLKPNPETLYESNGYLYRTNAEGKLVKVSGQLSLEKAPRNSYRQTQVGKSSGVAGDEGGHMIGTQFNGLGEGPLHLVPQAMKLNRGAGSKWSAMERKWADALGRGDKVKVEIEVKWLDGAKRPDGFKVNYDITDAQTGITTQVSEYFSNP
jgi:DNA/RNA non-specific endonuclease